MAKRYETKGFLQNVELNKMLPVKYEVFVSKDKHTTMTIAIKGNATAYTVDITDIAKDIVNKATI